MTWTHDTELATAVAKYQAEFGQSALAIAVDRLTRLEKQYAELAKQHHEILTERVMGADVPTERVMGADVPDPPATGTEL